MKITFTILVIVHGLIHLLGFIKAFGLSEIKELALPISKPMGIVWLVSAALFLIYGLLYTLDNKYALFFGIAAITISQVLVILFWPDAKIGSIPNLIILIALVLSYANHSFSNMVEKEKSEIFSKSANQKTVFFSESVLEGLPSPVKNWLLKSGAIGKPKILNGKIVQKAQMKMKPDQEKWFQAKALQYTVIDVPSFIWTVDMKMNPIMWVKGRDKFQNGKGEMLIKLNSILNIVNETGEKIDEGSLQRFLGEMVWFPSLAVSPYVSWEEINERTAKATMNYKGTKGSGTFYFNEEGDFIKYTAMRFQGNEPNAQRKEWILTVKDYSVFEGIKIPSKMEASWNLESGKWTWLKLEIEALNYNIHSNQ